jgi:hypothetical protein
MKHKLKNNRHVSIRFKFNFIDLSKRLSIYKKHLDKYQQ